MKNEIYELPAQLEFLPKIENEDKWGKFGNYFLAGMGGSHLQGGILNSVLPEFPLLTHKDYGLPPLTGKDSAIIAASYSGNTEEVLDVFKKALSRKVPLIAISRGGKLLEIAKEERVPYIKLPNKDIQPRFGTGYSFKALLKALGLERELDEEVKEAINSLKEKRDDLMSMGKERSSFLEEKIPVIYASSKNKIIATFFKVNFNETTKIPAFFNVVPELNHNEMNGYDLIPETRKIIEGVGFVLIFDKNDHPQNIRRMEVLESMLKERGLKTISFDMSETNPIEKVFSSIILSGSLSFHMAGSYGTDPEGVPMVEEFKKKIK